MHREGWMRRWNAPTKKKSHRRRRLRIEKLENRQLLASDFAAISGTVFSDLDDDGVFEPADGETGIAGVEVSLSGTDDLGPVTRPNATSDANGVYRFDNLRAGTYQLSQVPPPPSGFTPRPGASPAMVVISTADAAGVPGTSIDTFDGTEQIVTAMLPGSSPASSSATDAMAIGGTRDIFVDVTSPTGIITVSSDAIFRPTVLAINPDSSSTGQYIVTWDSDSDPVTLAATGLGGVDLTDAGASTALQMMIGIDKPGQMITVRVYTDATNFSLATVGIPETAGTPTGEILLPYATAFSVGGGTGADFSNVGAIQIEINATVAAADGQVDFLAALGPTVATANFANLPPNPSVTIEKSTNGQDADTATGPLLAVGSTATFSYVVTNTGNTVLGSVTVTDDQGLTPALVSGDTDGDGRLDLTETWTYQATTTVVAGQYTNIATVQATPVDDNGVPLAGQPNVNDTDPSNHFGVNAAVAIEKSTNGQDADTTPGPFLAVGSTASFQYVVTNPGNVSLADVAVTDDQGVTVTFVGGDTDADNRLDVTETWTYQGSATVTAGQYTNVATVTANPVEDNGNDIAGLADVNDTDPSNHFGAAPAIQIEKSTNGQDADAAPGPSLAVGSTASFVYTVTNPGNTALGTVVVTDDQGVVVTFTGGDTDGDNLLDTSETWTYTASTPVTAGAYANIGSVDANPVEPGGTDIAGLANVTDTDPSNHFGVSAAVNIEKSTNGQDADTGTGPTVFVGATVTFDYVVTNTGNVPLASVVVRDDNGTPGNTTDDFTPTFIGGDTDGDNLLDLTETWTYRATTTAIAGQYENTGTVTALDTLSQPVTDNDLSHYLGQLPPPLVSKRRYLASGG